MIDVGERGDKCRGEGSYMQERDDICKREG